MKHDTQGEIRISCWENGMILVTGINTPSTDDRGQTIYDCCIEKKDQKMIWTEKKEARAQVKVPPEGQASR